jgi:hypothetical protein
MKTKSIILIACILLLTIGCSKAPKDVELAMDKTSINLGETVNTKLTWNGTGKWVDYYHQEPGENEFTHKWGTDISMRNEEHQLAFPALNAPGTYSIYCIVYNCSYDGADKYKDCKGQMKSNTVTITVK